MILLLISSRFAVTPCVISTIAKLRYRFWKEPNRTTRISTVAKWVPMVLPEHNKPYRNSARNELWETRFVKMIYKQMHTFVHKVNGRERWSATSWKLLRSMAKLWRKCLRNHNFLLIKKIIDPPPPKTTQMEEFSDPDSPGATTIF